MDTVRYAYAIGTTREQMRRNLPDALWTIGDSILVWVNEGDICMHGKRLEDAPAQPVEEK